MAIRNIAHSIRVGEISLGVAAGVESMSLKSVSGRFASGISRGAAHRLFFLNSHSLSCSPRPTPVVVDAVRAHPQAHDCIQVRLLGP
jgi:acetyl-CoA acyltransferase 1